MELECSLIIWISALVELCINPYDNGPDVTDASTELGQPSLNICVIKGLVFLQDPLSLSNALKFAQDSRCPIFNGVPVVVKEVIDIFKFDANLC